MSLTGTSIFICHYHSLCILAQLCSIPLMILFPDSTRQSSSKLVFCFVLRMISFPKCTKYISSGEMFLLSQLYLSNTAMVLKKNNFVLEITMLKFSCSYYKVHQRNQSSNNKHSKTYFLFKMQQCFVYHYQEALPCNILFESKVRLE